MGNDIHANIDDVDEAAENVLQPTIQSKVPPAPFLQPNHSNSRSPMVEKTDLSKLGFAAEDDSHKLALLAQFNALQVPQHIVSNKKNEKKEDGDEQQKEIELNEALLEEIKKSIENPTSFHDVNMSQIKTDCQRVKLIEQMDKEEEEVVKDGA